MHSIFRRPGNGRRSQRVAVHHCKHKLQIYNSPDDIAKSLQGNLVQRPLPNTVMVLSFG